MHLEYGAVINANSHSLVLPFLLWLGHSKSEKHTLTLQARSSFNRQIK